MTVQDLVGNVQAGKVRGFGGLDIYGNGGRSFYGELEGCRGGGGGQGRKGSIVCTRTGLVGNAEVGKVRSLLWGLGFGGHDDVLFTHIILNLV